MKDTTPRNQPQKPNNAFFLFRKAIKDRIVSEFGITKSHEIARQAGILWKQESAEVKEKYVKESELEFARHKEMFPDYIWPTRNSKVNRKRALIAAAISSQHQLPSPPNSSRYSPGLPYQPQQSQYSPVSPNFQTSYYVPAPAPIQTHSYIPITSLINSPVQTSFDHSAVYPEIDYTPGVYHPGGYQPASYQPIYQPQENKAASYTNSSSPTLSIQSPQSVNSKFDNQMLFNPEQAQEQFFFSLGNEISRSKTCPPGISF